MNMKASDVIIKIVPRAEGWRKNLPANSIRNGIPRIPMPTRTWGTRADLRSLRAAELAAWELTGGDYLLPRCATVAGSQ
jgi:hypothetical protein